MRLHEYIRKIPGDDGFWKSASEETFLDAADQLRASGWDDKRILSFLRDIYQAVADCYGD